MKMQKLIAQKLIVIVPLLLPIFSYADNAVSLKVCVYDPEALMGQSKEYADVMASFEKGYQKKIDELKKEEDGLRDAANKFQAKATMLSEMARETEQEGLMRRKRDLEIKAKSMSEDYNMERQKTGLRYIKKLEEGISSFAQANGYDLILPKGPGVFAVASRADQTTAVLTHVNKKYEDGKKGTKDTLVVASNTIAKK